MKLDSQNNIFVTWSAIYIRRRIRIKREVISFQSKNAFFHDRNT